MAFGVKFPLKISPFCWDLASFGKLSETPFSESLGSDGRCFKTNFFPTGFILLELFFLRFFFHRQVGVFFELSYFYEFLGRQGCPVGQGPCVSPSTGNCHQLVIKTCAPHLGANHHTVDFFPAVNISGNTGFFLISIHIPFFCVPGQGCPFWRSVKIWWPIPYEEDNQSIPMFFFKNSDNSSRVVHEKA